MSQIERIEKLEGEIEALKGAIAKQGEYAADVELTSNDEFEIEYLWELHSMLVNKYKSKQEDLLALKNCKTELGFLYLSRILAL